MIKRGALIVLEGCDRSGKTTQCQKAIRWLQESNKEAHLMRFPDRSTIIGSLINKYLECSTELDDHAIHLLFSANRWELLPDIKKLLQKGTNVIVDRYSYSGIAFSAAKPNMDLRWCQQSDSGLLKPDLVIFLDIDPVEAQTRGQYGSERYENLEMQKVVRSNYLKLQDESWRVVDASRSMEEVGRDVCRLVQEALDNITPDSALKQLWI
ncbi:thymidylate kinase-like [Daphnia pulex]|uniref:thymidylate kinase-like n=1 Tax=Daphnia pulex TaxID=6669 RepID=UPI001EDE2A87|nr:thymidylate kinase-like [Daphnia pulex]XP_046438651.1 thymidylate kinase-like [Daphnia pulex]XP_046452383.1 thymidylate kinase-like [Daphnia pulex]XP_046639744.1 thymidylate kinase-like [Daphnia pulicaria]XP_046639748.1 thymidylate kinase-like [Daphnia pulicaria]XP_046639749.1 thymidylate kinase-like [Daphnia pulicaria]XP_046639762.1 thymidylate kinase-like [Daphnia pulicaria]